MPRRQPPIPKDFAFDLLADWRPFAEPLPNPTTEWDWRLYGTVTRDGQTGGLAWRASSMGIRIGALPVLELYVMERSRIGLDVHFERVPGWEGVPKFTPDDSPGYRGPVFSGK